jgi:hypothetical protein
MNHLLVDVLEGDGADALVCWGDNVHVWTWQVIHGFETETCIFD